MPAPKLKNLIILILLLANVLLLFLAIPAWKAARQKDDGANRILSQMYAEAQLTLQPDTIPQSLPLQQSTLSLNDEDSIRAVCAFLGEDTQVSRDGTAVLFSSQKGTATLNYGVLNILLDMESHDPRATVQQCLSAMGAADYTLRTEEQEGVTVYMADFIVHDVAVLDRPLSFYFSNGRLTEILGFLLPAKQVLTPKDNKLCLSAQDALLEFLSVRSQANWQGAEILSVTQGWTLQQNLSTGNVPLRPVWQIETDAARYFMDGITRSIRELN